MSTIITPNGTPANPNLAAQQQQRQPISASQMQQIIGAYARLKEINSATIANPRDDAEKQGLINFLNSALLSNAEELFGAWVAVNQEYSPLITGFTALLQRALARIDSVNRAAAAVQEQPETAK